MDLNNHSPSKWISFWLYLCLGLYKNGGWWRWALVSPDGVAPSQMVRVSASVNLPLHHKVRKFSSGTGSPRQYRKLGHKMVVVWWYKLLLQSTQMGANRI